MVFRVLYCGLFCNARVKVSGAIPITSANSFIFIPSVFRQVFFTGCITSVILRFPLFIVYICLEGAASVQVPSVKENGEAYMENYEFSKGETILVPADMPDFFLVPRDRETILLEAVTRPVEEVDGYIDPETEAFLENEDYEGLEDGAFDDDEPQTPSGASPLNFFS